MSNILGRSYILSCLFVLMPCPAWTLIMSGGADPVPNQDWPARSDALANLPSRFAYWVGDPSSSDHHFEYRGNTHEFQTAVDALAAIDAPRVELLVFQGQYTSPVLDHGIVHWEFEVWSREWFRRLNNMAGFVLNSHAPFFGRSIPPPRMSIYLGSATEVQWSAIRIPRNVVVLDRRVSTSPWADSSGGVIRAIIRDMVTGEPIAGAQLEVGRWGERPFFTEASAESNLDGVALLLDLPAGNHPIRVRREGYATREIGYYKNLGATLEILDDVKLAPASEIHGRVTNADGDPLEGVTVRAMGTIGANGTAYKQTSDSKEITALTRSDGSFTLGPLPMGRVALGLKKDRRSALSQQTYPVPGDDVALVMQRPGNVQGRIVNWRLLPADQRAYVKLVPVGDPTGRWGAEKQCDPGGRFGFFVVPPDRYKLVLFVARPTESGYTVVSSAEVHLSHEFTLEPGQELKFDLELVLPPSIKSTNTRPLS